MATPEENVQLDLLEIEALLPQVNRSAVREALLALQTQLQSELGILVGEVMNLEPPEPTVCPMCRPIFDFTWDQDDTHLTIKVDSLPGIDALPPDHIDFKYDSTSIDVKVYDLQEENYQVWLRQLTNPIDGCEMTVTPSGFILKLKKKQPGHWDSLYIED